MIDIMNIANGITFRWIPEDFIDDKSTMVLIMA